MLIKDDYELQKYKKLFGYNWSGPKFKSIQYLEQSHKNIHQLNSILHIYLYIFIKLSNDLPESRMLCL